MPCCSNRSLLPERVPGCAVTTGSSRTVCLRRPGRIRLDCNSPVTCLTRSVHPSDHKRPRWDCRRCAQPCYATPRPRRAERPGPPHVIAHQSGIAPDLEPFVVGCEDAAARAGDVLYPLACDYSSRVLVSPSAKPSARALSKRRIIFPLRVLGRLSTKEMVCGRAMGPISCATCSRNSSTN